MLGGYLYILLNWDHMEMEICLWLVTSHVRCNNAPYCRAWCFGHVRVDVKAQPTLHSAGFRAGSVQSNMPQALFSIFTSSLYELSYGALELHRSGLKFWLDCLEAVWGQVKSLTSMNISFFLLMQWSGFCCFAFWCRDDVCGDRKGHWKKIKCLFLF